MGVRAFSLRAFSPRFFALFARFLNARSLRMRDVARIERRGQFLLSDFVVSLNWDAQSAAARLVLVKADNVAPVFVYARSCGYSDSVGG